MQIIIKNKDTLLYDDFKFKCALGKNGVSSKKIEGDNKTPKGTYALGPLYFRKDRLSKPLTKIKTIQINKNFRWCDDIKSRFYNKLIKTKKRLNVKIYLEKIENTILY